MRTAKRKTALAAAAGACFAAAGFAGAQVFDPDYAVPRTPYGQPDLQGVWSNAVLTPLERPADLADKETLTEEEAAEYARQRREATNRDRRADDSQEDILDAYNDFWWDSGDNIVRTRRTSLIVEPRDGRVPNLTPAAQARLAELRVRRDPPEGPEDLSLGVRCLYFPHAGPPMLPGSYNNHYQLVQTEDFVLIVNEMGHETRIIPLDERAPIPAEIRQWRGSSRGRWDGDTLIVETTHRRADTPLRGSGENMRLIERFTRVDDDVLLYEFTVDDPESFERPWTVQSPSVRAEEQLYEFACHEGNRSLEAILAGARAAERGNE